MGCNRSRRSISSSLRARRGHTPHRLRQLTLVQPCKAESRKWLRLAVECVPPSGVPGHTVPDAAPRPFIRPWISMDRPLAPNTVAPKLKVTACEVRRHRQISSKPRPDTTRTHHQEPLTPTV